MRAMAAKAKAAAGGNKAQGMTAKAKNTKVAATIAALEDDID